jgi:hypothetical protein
MTKHDTQQAIFVNCTSQVTTTNAIQRVGWASLFMIIGWTQASMAPLSNMRLTAWASSSGVTSFKLASILVRLWMSLGLDFYSLSMVMAPLFALLLITGIWFSEENE